MPFLQPLRDSLDLVNKSKYDEAREIMRKTISTLPSIPSEYGSFRCLTLIFDKLICTQLNALTSTFKEKRTCENKLCKCTFRKRKKQERPFIHHDFEDTRYSSAGMLQSFFTKYYLQYEDTTTCLCNDDNND